MRPVVGIATKSKLCERHPRWFALTAPAESGPQRGGASPARKGPAVPARPAKGKGGAKRGTPAPVGSGDEAPSDRESETETEAGVT